MPNDGSDPSLVKNSNSKPTLANQQNVECMGCKAVAFFTPLAVSGYLYSQLGTKKQLETWGFASQWKGSQRWRFHMHRFNMAVAVPLGVCFFMYSSIFDFGMFKEIDPERPLSIKEDFQDDWDRFTKGTMSVAYWLRDTVKSKSEKFSDIVDRSKRMIDAPTTEPKQNNDD